MNRVSGEKVGGSKDRSKAGTEQLFQILLGTGRKKKGKKTERKILYL